MENRRGLVVGPDGFGSRRVENDGLVGLAAGRVVVGAAGALVGDADIAKECLAGGLVKIEPIVRTYDRAAIELVGDSKARREVELVAVVDVVRRSGS